MVLKLVEYKFIKSLFKAYTLRLFFKKFGKSFQILVDLAQNEQLPSIALL